MARWSTRSGWAYTIATLTALLLAGIATAPRSALAASTCPANGFAVTPLQTDVFYIDVAEDYLGSYVGYEVRNSGAGARQDLWFRLESFTGNLQPAVPGATTPALPVGELAAGAASPAYAYLRAPAPTTTAQTHDVVLYQGRPGAGGVEICRETQTVSSVADVIKAAANKVTSASFAPGTANLGGTFEITVTGDTGTVGSGPTDDPGVLRFSPAVAANWPASAFRLVGVSHAIPTSSAPVPDVLARRNMSGPDRPYSVTYTFRVVGPTSAPTPLVPVQNIASGTQVKHTDPGSLGALAPIPVVTSSATASVARGGTGTITPGDQVPLRATLDNPGSDPISVDQVVLHLPPSWSYVAGSATQDGSALPDPYTVGSTELHLVGPFTIPSGQSVTFGVTGTAGSAGSSGDFTAVGALVGGQIDSTTDPRDDAPARMRLAVLGSPTAADDAASVVTGETVHVDVVANDTLAGGTPTLTVLSGPSHGTVTLSGGGVSYTATPGYTGPDSFDYELSTQGGTDQATVNITVTPPPALPSPPALTSTGTGTQVQHVTAAIPAGGSVALLDPSGNRVTAWTVAGAGTYRLDTATGRIEFAPVFGFAGTPAAVRYEITDRYGQQADSTYTPGVNPPAPPSPGAQTSTGVGPATQSRRLPVPAGGSVVLLDAHGAPATQVVTAQGTYALDPASATVSFVPATGFSGAATGVRYRVTDAYGQHGVATYVPTVTLPPPPAPADGSSSGGEGASQGVQPSVPAGGSIALVDASGSPATTVTVPGEGTYTLDRATGTIVFTPEPGFTGQASGVQFAVTDAYGQTVRARYVPTVVAGPPPVAAPVAAPPAIPAAPRRTAVARPRTPRAAVQAGRLAVTAVGKRRAAMPVSCRLRTGRVKRCDVTVTAVVQGRRVVVGRGHRVVAGQGARRVAVKVRLTPLGRALAHRLGGTPVRVEAAVRPRGASKPAHTTATSRIVARTMLLPRPVFFDTDSAALRPGELRYLRGLRAKLAGVRQVTCTGYTDSRDTTRYNRALGAARARAVCAFLRRGARVGTRWVTRGEGRPFAANTTPRGRQLNRRTEIRLRY